MAKGYVIYRVDISQSVPFLEFRFQRALESTIRTVRKNTINRLHSLYKFQGTVCHKKVIFMNTKSSYVAFIFCHLLEHKAHLGGLVDFVYSCVSDLGFQNVFSVNKYKEKCNQEMRCCMHRTLSEMRQRLENGGKKL